MAKKPTKPSLTVRETKTSADRESNSFILRRVPEDKVPAVMEALAALPHTHNLRREEGEIRFGVGDDSAEVLDYWLDGDLIEEDEEPMLGTFAHRVWRTVEAALGMRLRTPEIVRDHRCLGELVYGADWRQYEYGFTEDERDALSY